MYLGPLRKWDMRFIRQAEGTIYIHPLLPCARCASKILEPGLVRVVASSIDKGRWQEQNKLAIKMFREAGISVETIQP